MQTRKLVFLGLALLLAFTAIGSRSLWDPDEGRYTNVALNMLESGDWVHPMRSDEVAHWTKPPVTYWAIASSVGVFGYHPWAARIPSALAFLATIWLTFRIARRIVPGRESSAAIIYATMFLPLIAAHWVSTDFLLTAVVALAIWGFVEARWGTPGTSRKRWVLVMWLGFALAFMTKGPPGLMYLPVLLLFLALAPGKSLRMSQVFWPPAVLAFAVLGFTWYLAVLIETPALWDYFIGAEVVDRIAGSGFGRNAEWYGWLKVYLPVLVLGTLPWTARVWRAVRSLGSDLPRWLRSPKTRRAEAQRWFLWLWVLVPLLVFCIAKSRLPLYLMPLFPALAILAAAAGPPLGTFGRRQRLWLGAWVVALIALRFAWAAWPTDKDAGRWAEAIESRAQGPVSEVVFVDHPPIYGLHLHLGAMVQVVSIAPRSEHPLQSRYDHDLAHELAQDQAGRVFVTRTRYWDEFVEQAQALGVRMTPLGAPYEERIIAVIERSSAQPAEDTL